MMNAYNMFILLTIIRLRDSNRINIIEMQSKTITKHCLVNKSSYVQRPKITEDKNIEF